MRDRCFLNKIKNETANYKSQRKHGKHSKKTIFLPKAWDKKYISKNYVEKPEDVFQEIVQACGDKPKKFKITFLVRRKSEGKANNSEHNEGQCILGLL